MILKSFIYTREMLWWQHLQKSKWMSHYQSDNASKDSVQESIK